MPKALFIASFMFLAACSATGGTPAQTVATGSSEPMLQMVDQGSAARVGPNEIVCRYEASTGTRMRQRICRTQAEWDAIQEHGRELMRHTQTLADAPH